MGSRESRPRRVRCAPSATAWARGGRSPAQGAAGQGRRGSRSHGRERSQVRPQEPPRRTPGKRQGGEAVSRHAPLAPKVCGGVAREGDLPAAGIRRFTKRGILGGARAWCWARALAAWCCEGWSGSPESVWSRNGGVIGMGEGPDLYEAQLRGAPKATMLWIQRAPGDSKASEGGSKNTMAPSSGPILLKFGVGNDNDDDNADHGEPGLQSSRLETATKFTNSLLGT